MNILEAVEKRHSVRSYTDKKIEGEVKEELLREIEECNTESGLNIQLVLNEPKAFSGMMAKYGKFSNANNYIALIGKNDDELDEKCGYFGEKIVLKAQQLGLNTCWVALSYSKVKSAYKIKSGEKLCCVISIGYGENQGTARKTKSFSEVSTTEKPVPNWYENGIEASLLAPTAVNQQKFKFTLKDKLVTAKAGLGFYSKIDLGIVKYHFEIGAGKENFTWSK